MSFFLFYGGRLNLKKNIKTFHYWERNQGNEKIVWYLNTIVRCIFSIIVYPTQKITKEIRSLVADETAFCTISGD